MIDSVQYTESSIFLAHILIPYYEQESCACLLSSLFPLLPKFILITYFISGYSYISNIYIYICVSVLVSVVSNSL